MNTDEKVCFNTEEHVYCVVINEHTFKEVEKIHLATDLPISFLVKELLLAGIESYWDFIKASK